MRASILLLCWNHARYIQQCLESIFKQTYKNIEVIFIDNASSDDSFEVVKSMLEKSGLTYKVFKNESPQTVSKNLNFLLSQSCGEFIFPFSSDDWMAPENIELKVELLRQPGIGLVLSGGWYYYEDKDEYKEADISKFKRDDMVLNLLLNQESYFWIGTSYPRTVLLDVGQWDDNLLIEDLDLHIRIAMKYKVDFVPKSLTYYRRHSASFMTNYRMMHKGFIQFYNKYYKNNNLPINQWMSNACNYFAYQAAASGRLLESWSFLTKSYKLAHNNGAFKRLWPCTKVYLFTLKPIRKAWQLLKDTPT